MKRSGGAMHVVTIRRRHGEREYASTLVRRSIREGKRVRKETVANLSRLPAEAIEAVRRALAGETLVRAEDAFAIERSLPHGHVAAVLGTARRLGLERMIARGRSRERDLTLALVCQRLLRAGSKLSATRQFGLSTLGEELAVEGAGEAELLAAMDWLLARQERVEAALARRYLSEGGFLLYDLSASYLEGRKCPLAALGYPRDGKKGKLQIQYGLTCSPEGRPVAVEVFDGKIHDDKTLPSALERIRRRFGIERVVVCGDRGMVTEANIETLRAHGFDWITALRAPQVQALVETGELQLSLFDERNLAEIASERYPGERLVVCRNPHVARERARKREALLTATEKELATVRSSVDNPRGHLHDKPAGLIGERAGRVVNRYKVAKHFQLTIEDGRFAYERKEEAIVEEAALDGFYVLRTSVAGDDLTPQAVVRAYKLLAHAEQAFRAMKSPELEIRPLHHRLEDRVRAHVFICMLAYAVRFELEQRLAPLLFKDNSPLAPADPVAPAQRSPAGKKKAASKQTEDGLPVSSFRDLLDALATLCRNQVRLRDSQATFDQLTEQNDLQRHAFELLELNPNRR
ncbi:MAG TPA: IS1634 family transposase [Gaiellaceae bacterium]|nr:IS1634 family transposase [Gaiellaceae bacterium]